MDFTGIAGLVGNVFSGLLQASEARKRFNAIKQAAKNLQFRQDREFAVARNDIRGAQSSWENDPGRLSLRQMWQDRLANPDVVSPGDLSNMKQQALSSAGSESAGAINSLREQAQRSGLGGSKMALGAEAGLRSRAFGKAAGISTGLDFEAKQANRASQDQVREGYGSYVSGENDTRTSFAQQLAQMLGSRQYGESSLYAMMN